MQSRKLLLVLSSFLALAAASPGAEPRVWKIGEAFRITLPETYERGVPFTVTIEILQEPAEAQQLDLRFNYIRNDGSFGGSLQPAGPRVAVTGVTKVTREVTITEDKPDLGVALLTVYLSPDGSWSRRTRQAAIPLLPAEGDRALFEKQAEQATRQTGEKPVSFERYVPRDTYFAQREDAPGVRDWKTDPQQLPPLEKILAQPPPDRPVYGVYCWADEFARAAAEIRKVGFRSARLSGPWANAGNALRFAAENDIEILYTLMAGDDAAAFRANRPPRYENDEAFLEAFRANIEAFLDRFGPEGSFFAGTGLRSPVRAIELWNEPNFHYLIPDGADRRAQEPRRQALYARMIAIGYDAVKAKAPGIQVAAFAAGGADSGDLRFIRAILESAPDVTRKMDLLSTHPYTKGAPPEAQRHRPWGSYSIANNLAEIRGLLSAAGAPEMPVWYTEMGWQIADEHGGDFPVPANAATSIVTPDLHAAYVVRNYLWALRLGIPRVLVMHLHDSDQFNGGFLDRATLAWRPTAHATRNLIALLPNPKILDAQSDGNGNTYVYRYQADAADTGSGQVIAAWNVAGPKDLRLAVPGVEDGVELRLYDLVGNTRAAVVEGGSVSLQAGPYPVFVKIQ